MRFKISCKAGWAFGVAGVALVQSLSGQAAAQDVAVDAGASEIVVTAQRREERLIDVPISVTALSGAALDDAGVSDLRNLSYVTPGLNFQAFGNAAQPSIRGVGSTSSGVGDGSNVPIYLDGNYQPYQGGNFLQLRDIERVEVLKGPQGTLYGRNAAGGAIVITTRNPTFTPQARLSMSYSRFNEIEGSAFVSLPVVADKLAVSLSGQAIYSDGFRKDIHQNAMFGYIRGQSIRGKVLFEPSDRIKVLLMAYYSNSNDLTNFGNQPYQGNTSVRLQAPNVLLALKPNTTAFNIAPVNINEKHGGNLKIDVDVGWAVLTSVTGLERDAQKLAFDSDLTPAANSQSLANIDIKMFTQDVFLTSQLEGPLSFIVGGSYYREDDHISLRTFGGLLIPDPNPPLRAGLEIDVKNRAFAAFGEVSYRITDKLKATAGLRYSEEEPGFSGRSMNVATGIFGAPLVTTPVKFSKLTPRAVLQYQFTPELNAYASFSRGYKSGVFNPLALQLAPAKPETVDAYEVGVKGQSGSSFSFSAAGFYYDYTDLQFQAFGEAGSLFPVLRNAASAEIYGFEANVTVKPVERLRITAGATYMHGEYTDFKLAQVYRPRRDAAGRIVGGNISTVEDVSGNRIIRTPRFQATGTISYTAPLADGGAIGANVTGSYTGAKTFDVAEVYGDGAFAIFNANLSYTTPGGGMRVKVFGTNVFNSKNLASLQISGTTTAAAYWKPATYGVEVEYRF